MKKITSLFILMTMLPFVANAEIASKAYVDKQDDKLIFGRRDITNGEFELVQFDTMQDFIGQGGVVGLMDGLTREVQDMQASKLDTPNDTAGIAYATEESPGMDYDSSFNSEYIGDGGIAWKSINLPTPPAACAGTGGSCVLMFVGNDNPAQQKISWEIITRAPTGDAPSTTGAVTTGQYNTNTIGSKFNND